jgi:hypothetical protein
MEIDTKLKFLRVSARNNSTTIIEHVIQTNISRLPIKQENKINDMCMFCGSTHEITKEHVIPRWTYEGCTKKFFITNINGLNQTYNKTTIPACSLCNNNVLSSLEVYINKLFSMVDPASYYFNRNEIENIIRWLEIIDYKFQILNSRRIFLASKKDGYNRDITNIPLSVLRPKIKFSPSKAIAEIRRSFKRIIKKNKANNFNSLVVFKSSNKGFYFFHTMDEFIFIELPQYKIALFYFFKIRFPTIKAAHKAANEIIDKVY